MDKSILKRLEKLEIANPDLLILEATMPSGKIKAMRVEEYMQQPEPLDFRIVSGDNGLSALCDSALLWQYIFDRVMDGARFPAMENRAGMAGEQAISLVTALCASKIDE